MFEAKKSRADQVANFEKVDERIRNQIGMEYHLNVLESIEKGSKVLPDEPKAVTTGTGDDIKISEEERMKFKEKYSRWCSTTEKIENQLKQSYFKYYGQCDDDMKASLEEDPEFEDAHKSKNVLKLRVILRTVTFHYRLVADVVDMSPTRRDDAPYVVLIPTSRDFPRHGRSCRG